MHFSCIFCTATVTTQPGSQSMQQQKAKGYTFGLHSSQTHIWFDGHKERKRDINNVASRNGQYNSRASGAPGVRVAVCKLRSYLEVLDSNDQGSVV